VRSAHPTEADVGASWSSLDYVYRMEAGEAVLPRPRIK
jgi:catechol 1,2-dioxygenase